MLKRHIFTCFLFIFPISVQADLTGLSSILDIPKGTTFELTTELEVKANRNFQVIGKDHLLESFNTIHQPGNEFAGRHYRYPSYDNYLAQWRKNADQSYQDCLNRHRIHYNSDSHSNGNNSTIINRGDGSTNIIINQSKTTYTGSYQGPHSCIQPQHTLALLLIDQEKAEGGGIFKQGYKFQIDKLRHRRHGHFHSLTLFFDHPVAKGLRIVSTQHPQDIFVYQLQHQAAGDGFWDNLGAALNSVQHIGGQLFTITPPKKHYYE
ncbi:hypothetical protein ACMXYV_10235 [Neptuniibacter sp. SY11_33]|uniref:hypothetical protein n=1 Tax=Neptuniibacter sp. SY11_33 TaxID=3398215 RepID=UPI0039F5A1B1